jgi:hypothetical protein
MSGPSSFFDKNNGRFLAAVAGPKADKHRGNGHVEVPGIVPDQIKYKGQWKKWDFVSSSLVSDVARIQEDADEKTNQSNKEQEIDDSKAAARVLVDGMIPEKGDPTKNREHIDKLIDTADLILKAFR